MLNAPNATGNTKKRSYLQYDLREKPTAPFQITTTFEENRHKVQITR